jgi:hypothetical protein
MKLHRDAALSRLLLESMKLAHGRCCVPSVFNER